MRAAGDPADDDVAPPSGWASRCPRCGRIAPLDDGVAGCASCAAHGIAMPLVPFRAAGPEPAPPGAVTPGRGAMWRWASHLVPVGEPVTLGEGGTPLTGLDLADLPGRVLLKDERANPTGSFKDRLASAVVGRARFLGADTVAVASSGNAGLAVAAYAAAAGMRSVLLAAADPGLPAPTAAAATAMGSRVVLTPSFADRWTAVRTGVEELGWFPVTNYTRPPVSSHPSGILAYRTMAYEIAESLAWTVPDWVVVPVSRGDGLFGLWSGFVELAELGWTGSVPRMLAVERFPSLTDALARGLEQPEPVAVEGPVRAHSISDPQASAMAALALRASGGDAVCCDDEQLDAAWTPLARRGLLLELSSAAVLVGADALAAGGLLQDRSTAVLVVTAGPYAQQSLEGRGAGVPLRDPTDAAELAALADGVAVSEGGRFEG